MGSSDNLQPQAISLVLAFPCVATAAVTLRVYSRMLTRSFGAGQSATRSSFTFDLIASTTYR
jgi:hypothetical protein